LDATEQGSEIHPIHFELYAYERDEAHKVKEVVKESREAYLEYKEEQNEMKNTLEMIC